MAGIYWDLRNKSVCRNTVLILIHLVAFLSFYLVSHQILLLNISVLIIFHITVCTSMYVYAMCLTSIIFNKGHKIFQLFSNQNKKKHVILIEKKNKNKKTKTKELNYIHNKSYEKNKWCKMMCKKCHKTKYEYAYEYVCTSDDR